MKRIVLAGGSGFLGRALAEYFAGRAWDVVILTRTADEDHGARAIQWDARTPGPWANELDGAEAIVNLTGRSVDCRYNARNRREIMESRVKSTEVIGQVISQCRRPPRVWANASTATIYRHIFDQGWDEAGEIGATAEAKDRFSIEVARAWEDAIEHAETPGTRKVMLRTAMVLGCAKNSVFPVLRRLVRFGLGGTLGTGKQFVSWIHELDFCRALESVLENDMMIGSINICAPNPLPNAEMMRGLREVVRVPFGLPATEWMLEIGAFFLRTETELVLKSRRVVPGRLMESGFEFRFPHFRDAIVELHQRC